MTKELIKTDKAISQVFVARQPIFDRQVRLFAYELLFRSGFTNLYDHMDGDLATSQTIANSFINLGIDIMTGGKMAFVNFTKNLIEQEIATIFPSKLLGIEVLENVEPDKVVIEALKSLKKKGYLIILDDFVLKPGYEKFVELANIIKIDFKISDKEARNKILSTLKNKNLRFLAEKVETQQDFNYAREMGFSYFQGFFFSRPEILSRKEVPGYKLIYLQILRAINDPNLEFEQLEHIVKRDVSLTYKLLRFINSAAFSFPTKIKSIKQAITLLGLMEFKKWASIVALSGMGQDKPEELVINTMVRARFCELIAQFIDQKEEKHNLFLMGMFSTIDAFMDKPMEEILSGLPLSDTIKNALLGKQNLFRDVLDMIIAYENANWKKTLGLISKLNLDAEKSPAIYLASLEWASKIFK